MRDQIYRWISHNRYQIFERFPFSRFFESDGKRNILP
jgi:predicted DCC family thiol-disulfide oxidoreductase YuxK